MLNKLKLGMLVGVALTILKVVLPDVDFPEGFQEALVLLVVFATQFFARETEKSVGGLALK